VVVAGARLGCGQKPREELVHLVVIGVGRRLQHDAGDHRILVGG
jgi:hypothetical protein